MTITRAGLAGGTPADSATSVARSVGSVTAGQMVVFVVAVLNLSGSDDTFAAGDLTKTAGTSTIDTPQLDGQWGGQIGGGPEWLRVGVYSCLVTGSGTLTLTHAGAPSGSYLWAATEAYNGSWDSSRFEDSAGTFDATNNASSASTGNMDSGGGALFVGVLSVNNGANVTFTPDAAWTAQAAETSSAHVMGSFIDRIVTGATTDSADWTFTTLDGGGYAGTAFGGVVYKEVSGGGGGPTIVSADDDTPANGQSVTITVTGAGASQGGSTLTLGGVAQSVSSWGDTSITFTASRGTNKYGALTLEITVGGNSDTYPLTLGPQAGWDYVDVGTPETDPDLRLTGTPDLASGDQIAWETVGGLVEVFADGTFSADPAVEEFDFEIWTPGDGWGSLATQTLLDASFTPGLAYIFDGTQWVRRQTLVFDGTQWAARPAIPQ